MIFSRSPERFEYAVTRWTFTHRIQSRLFAFISSAMTSKLLSELTL